MVYMVMLTMQFVTATLRIRLVTAFLAIVIIPLAIVSAIQSRFMFDVLDQDTRDGLRIAAQQTALGVDSFFEESQKSTLKVARMEVLARYLDASGKRTVRQPRRNRGPAQPGHFSRT
jgi:hypothetical protein